MDIWKLWTYLCVRGWLSVKECSVDSWLITSTPMVVAGSREWVSQWIRCDVHILDRLSSVYILLYIHIFYCSSILLDTLTLTLSRLYTSVCACFMMIWVLSLSPRPVSASLTPGSLLQSSLSRSPPFLWIYCCWGRRGWRWREQQMETSTQAPVHLC